MGQKKKGSWPGQKCYGSCEWCGAVRCGAVQCGAVRCGVVWCVVQKVLHETGKLGWVAKAAVGWGQSREKKTLVWLP